jgi:hypothetical protein
MATPSSRAAKEFRLLTWEDRQGRLDLPEYRVMVFEPKGRYPLGTWHVPNGFFHADEQIVFSVVLGESWRMIDPDMPYSEFDWASPQELRLIASLILCEVMDGILTLLYPIVGFSPRLDAVDLDLQSPETVAMARSLLLTHLRQETDIPGEFSDLVRCRNTYDLFDPKDLVLERLQEFWSALAPLNYVLLRGVYALMKSDMLARHREFSEEAVVSLHIALEASFSLVIRRLKQQGVPNATAHDAAVWLHDHFDASFDLPAPQSTDKYFGEFYDQRVMTMHPSSRFGDLPYSPTINCDICCLRPILRQIFAYLLIGRHDPGYVEAVRDYTERGFGAG